MVQLQGIRSFHAPFHLFSQCFYICIISTKASNERGRHKSVTEVQHRQSPRVLDSMTYNSAKLYCITVIPFTGFWISPSRGMTESVISSLKKYIMVVCCYYSLFLVYTLWICTGEESKCITSQWLCQNTGNRLCDVRLTSMLFCDMTRNTFCQIMQAILYPSGRALTSDRSDIWVFPNGIL